MQWELHIPKSPGTPGPPNAINNYALGFNNWGYHLGELDVIIHRLEYK